MGDSALPRRTFVFFGMLFAAGCATRKSALVDASRLPDPDWMDIPTPVMQGSNGPVCPPPRDVVAARRVDAPDGADSELGSDPQPGWNPAGGSKGPVPYAIPRTAWTSFRPNPAGMERMLPPKYITIHHDGLDRPFTSSSKLEARARLQLILNGHRGRPGNPFSDIGYHYIVDRGGNVWQGRDVTRWQGAHVRSNNEHNIGVMCLGNFVVQKPSSDQVEGLNRVVATLRASYRIPASNVRTHREWKGAHTACPGDGLQTRVAVLRKSGFRMA